MKFLPKPINTRGGRAGRKSKKAGALRIEEETNVVQRNRQAGGKKKG